MSKKTLREVLELLDSSLPDKYQYSFEDIRPDGAEDVRICFMSESETWIETYATHPMLIPWYDCEVDSVGAEGDALNIWLDYVPFWKQMIGHKESDEDGRTMT